MAVEYTKRNRKPGVWRCYTGPHTLATYTVDCCTTEIAVAFCPGSLSFFGCSAYTTCSLARTTIASGTGWRTACTRTWHRLEQRRINYMYYAANYCGMPAFESLRLLPRLPSYKAEQRVRVNIVKLFFLRTLMSHINAGNVLVEAARSCCRM